MFVSTLVSVFLYPRCFSVSISLSKAIKLNHRKEMVNLTHSFSHISLDITERSYEKRLVQIATKGVVHLFNSIKKQQKLDKDIANSTSSSSKAEKLTQTSFFELLTKKKAK